jgi:cytochrome c oxidase subunit IV
MQKPYAVFWKTWGVLLALTLVMIFVDVMHMPRLVLLGVLLSAMLTKAFLIGARFMDLEHEKLVVGISVAFSILFFGAFLFAFIVPDGIAVLHGGR